MKKLIFRYPRLARRLYPELYERFIQARWARLIFHQKEFSRASMMQDKYLRDVLRGYGKFQKPIPLPYSVMTEDYLIEIFREVFDGYDEQIIGYGHNGPITIPVKRNNNK